jgi:hypothetical protein
MKISHKKRISPEWKWMWKHYPPKYLNQIETQKPQNSFKLFKNITNIQYLDERRVSECKSKLI